MRSVDLKILKNKLSEYVRVAESGRSVLTPPRMVHDGPPPRLPVAPTATILRELDEDRGER